MLIKFQVLFYACLLSRIEIQSVQMDGGMKRLQMYVFDSDFYLQQIRLKAKNVQLRKSTIKI